MSAAAILHLVQTNDDKHEEGHGRLRKDWRGLESRVLAIEHAQDQLNLRLTHIGERKTDGVDVQWSTRTLVGVVGVCVVIAAGQWGLNSRLEGNVKAAIEQNAKSQDERYLAIREWQARSDKEQAMQKYEIQNIKEMMLTMKGRTK